MWFCNIIIRADSSFISETSVGGWLFCPKQTFFWEMLFFFSVHKSRMTMKGNNSSWDGTPLDCRWERFESWFFMIISHDNAALINNWKCLRAGSRVGYLNLGFYFPWGTLKFLLCLCLFSFPRNAQLCLSLHWACKGAVLSWNCWKTLVSLQWVKGTNVRMVTL